MRMRFGEGLKKGAGFFFCVGMVVLFMVSTVGAITIDYSHMYWRDAEIAALEGAKAEFEKENPDIKIKATFIPYQDVRSTLLRRVAAGAPPDAAQIEDMWVHEMASFRALADLKPFISDEIYDSYIEEAWQPAALGYQYSLPNDIWLEPAMLYRADFFEEAGIEPQKPGDARWTMDEALAVAKKLSGDFDGDGIQDRWGWVERALIPGHLMKHFWWHLRASGIDAIRQTEEGKWKSGFDQEMTRETTIFYADLIRKHHVGTKKSLGFGFEGFRGSFVRGEIAMGSMGSWTFDIWYRDHPDLQYGVMELPYRTDPITAVYYHALVMFSESKHQEATWNWMKKIALDPKWAIPFADASGNLVLLRETLKDPVYQSEKWRPRYKPFIDLLLAGKLNMVTVNPHPKFMGIMDTIVGPTVHKMILEETTDEEAFKFIEKEINRVLGYSG